MRSLASFFAWLAAWWVAVLLAGCATPTALDAAPEGRWEDSIDRLAGELVAAAAARGELRGARVEVRTPALAPELARRAGREGVEVARRVREELEFALGTRVDLVVHPREGEPFAPFAPTHAVDGRIDEEPDGLRLGLRLVALDSGLVLAPARGALRLAPADAARLAPSAGPTRHHVPGTDDQHLPAVAATEAAAPASGLGPAAARDAVRP